MKKLLLMTLAVCLLLSGCGKAQNKTEPLPDTTMENLTDAILAVSLEEGGAYVDDTGRMQMDLTIYTYDLYDMAEFSQLKEGDTIVIQGKDVVVTSLERTDTGLVLINGGMEAGGYDFTHSDSGVYYEAGFNDVKSWYEVGKETIRVSTEMTGVDNGDPEMGEVELFPGSFLIGEVTDYNFTPYNTTVRVEDGQIVYMERIYTP